MDNKTKILTAIGAAAGALLLGYGIYKLSQGSGGEFVDAELQSLYEDLDKLGDVKLNH